MKITETGPLSSTPAARRARKAGAAGGASFASMLDAAERTDAAAPASGVEAPAAASALLAFQEVGDGAAQQRQSVQRAEDMLTSLDRLRDALLAGAVAPDVLRELEGRLALQRQQVTDPRLNALIDDIELRVAVELAKLEHTRASQNGYTA